MTAPLPPSDIATRRPLFLNLAAGTVLHRFYSAAYEPIFFDRGKGGRFNAADGSFGVLYVAEAMAGAFAETFLRQPGRTQLPADLLSKKAYIRIQTCRDLKLIKFSGPGLARLGATAEVAHGGLPYDAAQAWSASLYAHPASADGIAYTARHDDEAVCVALFDRSPGVVEEIERRTDLDQNWFWEVAERYGIGLAPI